jgi:hypothetical protein
VSVEAKTVDKSVVASFKVMVNEAYREKLVGMNYFNYCNCNKHVVEVGAEGAQPRMTL